MGQIKHPFHHTRFTPFPIRGKGEAGSGYVYFPFAPKHIETGKVGSGKADAYWLSQ